MATPELMTLVIVDAPCGKLQGLSKAGLNAFKGVPFAEPPVGPRRWAPPSKRQAWSGIREAVHVGPAALQGTSLLDQIIPEQVGTQSEDCLYLNVWTPGLDGGKRPVMVWIHGGAFAIGSGGGPMYNGEHLARLGDVVVVTLNYRLGSFGFLNLRDTVQSPVLASGTEGIMDQICALEWVRDNIASFGGDAENVTIFGESAGALSVGCLLGSPQAQGLFHKAILQSGAAHVGYPQAKSEPVARAMLDLLGLAPSDGAKLASVPADVLMNAQRTLLTEVHQQGDPRKLGMMPFGPGLDGHVLPERPISRISRGSAAGVPLLCGVMRDEFRLFTLGNAALQALDKAGLEALAVASYGVEPGRALLKAYSDGSPFDRWSSIIGDHLFRMPAIALAEAQASHAPSFVYRVDYCSPILDGAFRACHALDIGLVFGTYAVAPFFGTGPEVETLSRAMMTAWTRFAHTGDPTWDAGCPWARYDEDRATMIFAGEGGHMAHDPDRHTREVWGPLRDRVGFS
jgi:para-nitrobenzyl esterase